MFDALAGIRRFNLTFVFFINCVYDHPRRHWTAQTVIEQWISCLSNILMIGEVAFADYTKLKKTNVARVGCLLILQESQQCCDNGYRLIRRVKKGAKTIIYLLKWREEIKSTKVHRVTRLWKISIWKDKTALASANESLHRCHWKRNKSKASVQIAKDRDLRWLRCSLRFMLISLIRPLLTIGICSTCIECLLSFRSYRQW